MTSMCSRRFLGSIALLLLAVTLLLAACGTAPDEVEEAAAGAAANGQPESGAQPTSLLPTPTLLPELANITRPPPTPPLTPTAAPPTASPTVTATPSPTPLPAERIELGEKELAAGNYEAAVGEYEASLSQPGALERPQQEAALWGLSLAYMRAERFADAVESLNHYLGLAGDGPVQSGPATAGTGDGRGAAAAYFQLAEAQRKLGDYEAGIAAYQRYLEANPGLAAYVQPRIAACYLELGDGASALAAYEAALEGDAHRLTEVGLRQKVADYYLAAEDYDGAIAQYDAIHDLAQTENTRGQMTYLAGRAELLAGNEAAAYERYHYAVENYPKAYESYLGLVELVDAGEEVDAYQRGLVDYYAEAYAPAVAAFNDYLAPVTGATSGEGGEGEDTGAGYKADAHLYLAWSYEGLGDLEAALAALEAYAVAGAVAGTGEGESAAERLPHAAEAALERGKLYARAGLTAEAIGAYQKVVAQYPEAPEAPPAAWWAAVLAEGAGDVEQAAALYEQVAEAFPRDDNAAEALFRAGFLRWEAGDVQGAAQHWRDVANGHGDAEFAAAGLVWLMRTAAPDLAATYAVTATALNGATYYPLRAQEVAASNEPFEPPASLLLPAAAEDTVAQAEAEGWLEEWLELEPGTAASQLSPELAADGRLLRGTALWQLGQFGEGKLELEGLREAYAEDALASYQLALYFRDLGIYRSSILAAANVLRLSGQTVFEAPRLIGRLSYPVYYSELILPLAQQHGYDPLLQFALVRQESLYESFIASYAGAQGLSQVMPATGADIARQLAWPDYRNEDLYRPAVGLAFGAFYLAQQLDTFKGNVYAALSAYNAGPGNAARWYALAPDDPDLYLETVDYRETRLYIERIYVGHSIYRHLYGTEE